MMYGGRFAEGFDCFDGGFIGGYGHFMFEIGIFVFIAAIIIFFVWRKRKNNKGNNLLELLKMKYINGEITEEEYNKRKEVITKT